MLSQVFSIPFQFPATKKIFWTSWYNMFAAMYPQVTIAFMNYGYADINDPSSSISLNSEDETERYCLQLYNHVTRAISLEGLDVLEVGSGRGGGASYVKRYLRPKSMTGVDISAKNVELCRQKYAIPNLNFSQDNAEALSFANDSFDAVINVESSHCYPKINDFFREVNRVLRPGGHFLFTDFRPKDEIDDLTAQLTAAGFQIKTFEDITQNVLKSMDREHERKLAIIQNNIPKIFHGVARAFSGFEGTFMYEDLKHDKQVYFCAALQKV
jgi:ubiquinone/menaquinone biosynthesis C-methylase UbiE